MWFLSPQPLPGRVSEIVGDGMTGGGVTTPPPPVPAVPPLVVPPKPPEFELEARLTPGAVPELFVPPLFPGESLPEPGDAGWPPHGPQAKTEFGLSGCAAWAGGSTGGADCGAGAGGCSFAGGLGGAAGFAGGGRTARAAGGFVTGAAVGGRSVAPAETGVKAWALATAAGAARCSAGNCISNSRTRAAPSAPAAIAPLILISIVIVICCWRDGTPAVDTYQMVHKIFQNAPLSVKLHCWRSKL